MLSDERWILSALLSGDLRICADALAVLA